MKFNDIISDKKEFRIGFIGGSITEGVGASALPMRYASVFVRYMEKRFPDIKFTEINAGIGGTPSALGMFHLKHDVLDHDPDILFVEFAVNDNGYGDRMLKFMEGIVRTARRWNNNLPIVFLFTYAREFKDTSKENPTYIIREQAKIAAAYGIPCVYMGYDLLEKTNDFGGDDSFFLCDGVHPNDTGYALYADSIMRELFRADFSFEFPEKPISGTEFPHPDMIVCQELKDLPDGWQVSYKTLFQNPIKYIFSDKIGASISYDFEGTACGLYIRIEKDGGIIDVAIDDEKIGSFNFWDQFAKDFDRDGYMHLADDLEYGKHTVTITVSAQKSEQSEGHTVRIAGFLAG